MAFNKRNLADGEVLVLALREHVKALFWPTVVLLLLAAVVGVGVALMPAGSQPVGTWVLVGLAVVLAIWLVFMPWLRWYSTTIAITDRRIITRRGIINRKGHDVPLRRINNVNYDRDLLDRIFGCGTLTMETAAGEPLVLHDIPNVERVQVQITELLFNDGPDGDPRGE